MKTFEELKSELNAKWTGFTVRARVNAKRALEWTKENKEVVKPSEALEIDKRRSEGESMAHILASMKLLK